MAPSFWILIQRSSAHSPNCWLQSTSFSFFDCRHMAPNCLSFKEAVCVPIPVAANSSWWQHGLVQLHLLFFFPNSIIRACSHHVDLVALVIKPSFLLCQFKIALRSCAFVGCAKLFSSFPQCRRSSEAVNCTARQAPHHEYRVQEEAPFHIRQHLNWMISIRRLIPTKSILICTKRLKLTLPAKRTCTG